MATPATRTPVRIARGSYSNLNSSLSDLQDGEITYAEDQNKLYIKEGSALVVLTLPAANPVFTGNATFDTNTLYVDGTNNSVNIGTTTTSGLVPLLHLHKASSAATAYLHITNTDSGVASSDGFIVGFNGSNDALLFNKESTPMRFATAGLERLRIDSAGKVGIGTTSPTELLDVSSTGASTAIEISAGEASTTTGEAKLVLRSLHSSSGTSYSRSEIASLGVAGGDSDLIFRTTTQIAGPEERMRIDSAGRVGIGAFNNTSYDSNAQNLLLSNESGNYGITIRSGGGDPYAMIHFADGTTDASEKRAGRIFYHHVQNKLTFSTANTEALTLDSSQNATFASAIYGPVKAVSALDLDLSTGNYFTKTINGNSTFTFSNPAASGTVTAFTLELTHTSGNVIWPTSVKWNADTEPTLASGKTHLFMFVTDDGGTRYRGSALVDYVN